MEIITLKQAILDDILYGVMMTMCLAPFIWCLVCWVSGKAEK